jgi:hypothetical protein
VIHLNGSGKNRLLEGYEEAAGAVRKALVAVHENGPNARDYYVAGDNAFREAAAEHQSRVDRLNSVYAELGEIMEHIADS